MVVHGEVRITFHKISHRYVPKQERCNLPGWRWATIIQVVLDRLSRSLHFLASVNPMSVAMRHLTAKFLAEASGVHALFLNDI